MNYVVFTIMTTGILTIAGLTGFGLGHLQLALMERLGKL
jgi:hypothetical protein